jgi:hypothetical protein
MDMAYSVTEVASCNLLLRGVAGAAFAWQLLLLNWSQQPAWRCQSSTALPQRSPAGQEAAAGCDPVKVRHLVLTAQAFSKSMDTASFVAILLLCCQQHVVGAAFA